VGSHGVTIPTPTPTLASQSASHALANQPIISLPDPQPTSRHLFLLGSLGLIGGCLLVALHMATNDQDFLLETLTVLDLAGLAILLLVGVKRSRDKAIKDAVAAELLVHLSAAKQSAESANLAKSRYLASISHEIRSPLNAIYGYAQLFERGDGVNAQEAARVILRCSEHLTNLVEGLLDISQLEFGVLRVRTEEVRLGQFMEQVISMMRPAASSKGLIFTYDGPERLPEVVRLDQNRFRQVLINLLSNAIKFTEQGSVTLKLRYAAQIAIFEVSDTGPGIPAEDHERIFERFERGTQEPVEGNKAPKPGAGLGLAIARTIVEILGGKLELQSEVGKGTTFRITMMLSEVSGRHAQLAPVRKLVGHEGRQRTILLVEDDGDQRFFLETLLRSLGFIVFACPNGEEALERSETVYPDLAILDISLPGLSGWQTGEALRERFGEPLQILMLSANSEELHRPEYDTPRHDRFLVKPVEFESLVDMMGDMLGLTWCRDDSVDDGPLLTTSNADQVQSLADIGEDAMPHIVRLREFLRIGYTRGIETEIKQLEQAAPQAQALVRQLYDCLDRFDLAAMARLVQEQ